MIERFSSWVDWRFPGIAYRVRPFDMLADRRRWFWQPRQKCGWWG